LTEIVGFSGNTHRPSSTRTLVDTVVNAIQSADTATAQVFDVLDLGDSFGSARRRGDLSVSAEALFSRVEKADVLVVGSPVYNASYSGLFKHFFDLMAPDALRYKLICLTATGGADRHALVLEQHMRPLFGFFGALSMPTSVFASRQDFREGRLSSPAVVDRINRLARELKLFQPVERWPLDDMREFSTAEADDAPILRGAMAAALPATAIPGQDHHKQMGKSDG